MLVLVFLILGVLYLFFKDLSLKESKRQKSLTSTDTTGYETFSEIKKHKDTGNWLTYKNTYAGYEIRYPSDWALSIESFGFDPTMPKEDSLEIDIAPPNRVKDFLFKITVEAYPDSLTDDINVGTDESWNKFKNNYLSWRLKDKKISDVVINGTRYTLTEGTSTDSGIPEDFYSRSYITRINDGKGTLAVVVRDRSVPRSEIFEQIVSTLKLTK